MLGKVPVVRVVTLQAQGGLYVVHDKEVTELVVMWIMAGCALHLTVFKEHVSRERRRGAQFAPGGAQEFIIDKGNRVVVAEVGCQIAVPDGQGRSSQHRNFHRLAFDHAQRNGAVMTTQAQFG